MIKLEKNLKFQEICANHPAFQFPIVLPLELLKFVQELLLDAFGSARAEAEGDDFVAVVISIGHDSSGVMALLSCEAVGEGGEDAVVQFLGSLPRLQEAIGCLELRGKGGRAGFQVAEP